MSTKGQWNWNNRPPKRRRDPDYESPYQARWSYAMDLARDKVADGFGPPDEFLDWWASQPKNKNRSRWTIKEYAWWIMNYS